MGVKTNRTCCVVFYLRPVSCVPNVASDPSGAPKFTSVFSGVRVVINRSLFILLCFLFRLLYCLSFDLRLPVTPMVHVYRHFQQYFNYSVVVSVIGGGKHRPVASH
jgi:hypothetical protein